MATKSAPRKPATKPAPARDTTATTPTTARKPAEPRAVPAAPVVVAETPADLAQPDLKRQELLAQVVARSEVKKKFAKPVLEAALALIGEALAEGRDLNLAPMGKVKINRTRQMANGRVMAARIRQNNRRLADGAPGDDTDAKEGVADPANGR
ncbi:MAG: HU family DNA-binding protein [Roseovarius sp.]|nr:HU family DNA-binding protein [Roseovarius sp.]